MSKSLFYTRRIYSLYGFRKASYFWLQAQLHRELFARWFGFVDEALPQDVDELYKIRLVMRPAFRFMRPGFCAADRVSALMHHYTAFKKKFPERTLLAMMQENAGCRLAEITGKSGKKYIFETRGDVTKEGAIRVVFIDAATGFVLANITGILAPDNGKTAFHVGMLRGPGQKIVDSRELVVSITKDLNGLRPKQAVLHAAAALAEWLGAAEIAAAPSDKEIAMKTLFKGHKVLANHDPFWQEFTAAPATDGLYHLPLPLPRRDETEVQQKRRKDWRARYAHIDGFSADIKNSLAALSEG
ncbi:MAG: DUF535 family protein [Alphaproteobacteria bacterium]|nr:DUF535 family protein [Alphaproteobacteria bacterium]MDE2336756.1 DUF535 family protein [Alphaproteobacteria bacterium]